MNLWVIFHELEPELALINVMGKPLELLDAADARVLRNDKPISEEVEDGATVLISRIRRD